MTGRLWLENRPHVETLGEGVLDVRPTGLQHRAPDGVRTQVMPEVTAAVLIGPGCAVTSTAVRSIVDGGCQLLWLSKTGLRVEAVTAAPTGSSLELVSRQSRLVDPSARRQSAIRSLELRFSESPPSSYSENQLRGWEGAKMRAEYQQQAASRSFQWAKRVNNGKSDLLNAMISSCNAAVYTAVHAGILALNMSPHLGWLHAGPLAAVYDFAEHYKHEQSIARVFDWFASRERDDALPSSFAFAKAALPEILRHVFDDLHDTAEKVLP